MILKERQLFYPTGTEKNIGFSKDICFEYLQWLYIYIYIHIVQNLQWLLVVPYCSFFSNILWMEEILHQLVYGLSHCNPIIYSVL